MLSTKVTHAYQLRSISRQDQEKEVTIPYTVKDHGIDEYLSDASKNKRHFQYFPTHRIISEADYVSDAKFKGRIYSSLSLLRSEAPEYYSLFCLFNKTIRAANQSYCNFSNDSIDIGPKWYRRRNIEIAAMIIHETVHFWQFENGYIDRSSLQDCELEAFKYEINVLKRLNAREHVIQDCQRQRGLHNGARQYMTW